MEWGNVLDIYISCQSLWWSLLSSGGINLHGRLVKWWRWGSTHVHRPVRHGRLALTLYICVVHADSLHARVIVAMCIILELVSLVWKLMMVLIWVLLLLVIWIVAVEVRSLIIILRLHLLLLLRLEIILLHQSLIWVTAVVRLSLIVSSIGIVDVWLLLVIGVWIDVNIWLRWWLMMVRVIRLVTKVLVVHGNMIAAITSVSLLCAARRVHRLLLLTRIVAHLVCLLTSNCSIAVLQLSLIISFATSLQLAIVHIGLSIRHIVLRLMRWTRINRVTSAISGHKWVERLHLVHALAIMLLASSDALWLIASVVVAIVLSHSNWIVLIDLWVLHSERFLLKFFDNFNN